ncbi:MAG: MFS transporter [Elusimicrobia bacterium]|nr:MFS transporter [Elusimicrobiota bacterium]
MPGKMPLFLSILLLPAHAQAGDFRAPARLTPEPMALGSTKTPAAPSAPKTELGVDSRILPIAGVEVPAVGPGGQSAVPGSAQPGLVEDATLQGPEASVDSKLVAPSGPALSAPEVRALERTVERIETGGAAAQGPELTRLFVGDSHGEAPPAPSPTPMARFESHILRNLGPAPKDRAAHPPGFKPLLASHFLGVFNDTAVKTLFSVWVTALLPQGQAGLYIALATALFTLPYILFSVAAGRLADRLPKGRLLIALKAVEVAAVAAGAAAFALHSLPGVLAVIFILGAHSALMSPAKYSLIPELVKKEKLSRANGLMEMATFFSLIAGTAVGGLLYAALKVSPLLAAAVFVPVSAAGLWTSLRLKSAGQAAAAPGQAKPRMPRALVLAALAIATFWFLSSILQMNLLLFAGHTLGLGAKSITAMLTLIGVATSLGSYAAGLLSKNKVELGIVPLGTLGVAACLFDLALFGAHSPVRAFVDLALLGFSSGLFYIPLNSYLENESPEASRGRFIGISNLMTFGAILASAGAFYLLNSLAALSPAAIFAASAALAAAAAVWTLARLRGPMKEFLARLLRRRQA